MASKINPVDPIYQRTDQFKPNQAEHWVIPPEKMGWLLANNAMRCEMKLFREALVSMNERGETLKEWELKALTTAANTHFSNIHSNHKIKAGILAPACHQRFKCPEKLELEIDRAAVIKKLDSIKTIVGGLTTSDKIDNLLEHWIEYEKMMLLYLLDEETVIPLYRAYFDQKSAGEVAQKIMKNMAPAEFGSLLYFDKDHVFRTDLMNFLNIPSISWKVEFEKNLKLFAVEFIGNVEALMMERSPT
eukprot:CAMPEP_0172416832 /NCGR_PEP_ID=MMETSP1064-20121228/3326_1 /TAXON_ID=202472 /ORGANISM="Aulacoseira subarctica , Strain CCAP 1002/5" /LENGTH=245 /DNA_ID=CAMNT_0013154757 /DNA_START=282 /DNA_END=1020 /DNA_ORIENTATION=+